MDTIDVDSALLSVYNASFGGKYELAGEISDKEELAEQEWITYAKCKNDPNSTHNASSCRITLSRMTKTGIIKAQELVDGKYSVAFEFLNNLESLPPKVEQLYRYLMKKWLSACTKRDDYNWDLKLNRARYGRSFPLPNTVIETITSLNERLIENGLASYASLHHNTSGPSDPTLMTCPEIKQMFMQGRGWKEPYTRGVQHTELNEYLQYLLNGYNLINARYHLLFFFGANRYSVRPSILDYLHEEYGVDRDSLMGYLEELEDSNYIHILTEEEREEEYVLATGRPFTFFSHVNQDIDLIKKQVKEKVIKWFETGEEPFQRFAFTRYF